MTDQTPFPYAPGPQGFGPQYGQPMGGTPENLDLPLYGATFPQAMKRFWKKMFRFEGRASLSEYWWAYLGLYIAAQALSIVFMMAFYGVGLAGVLAAEGNSSELSPGAAIGLMATGGIFLLLTLALAAVHLGITARRLHDGGFSALWLLLYLTGVGGLVILVMTLMPSSPKGLQYDPAHIRAQRGY